jgi:hypothetical protein
VQRMALRVTENWSFLKSSLQLILLPPLAMLIAGFTLGWIVTGFRAKQPLISKAKAHSTDAPVRGGSRCD